MNTAVVDKTLNLRVSADVRAQLINSTVKSFQDDELRAIEKKAKETFIKELNKLPNLYNLTEKKVFEKFKYMNKVTSVDVPSQLTVEIGKKEFTLPSGEKVLRGEKVKINAPRKLEYTTNLFNPRYSDEYSFSSTLITLETPLELPIEKSTWDRNLDIKCHYAYSSGTATYSSNLIGGEAPDALTKALEQYYLASENRFKKEVKIIRAMVSLIKAAKKYYEIVNIWPDAEKTIRQIVTAPVAPNRALVLAISDTDKNLLCEYFTKKKQAFAACYSSDAAD